MRIAALIKNPVILFLLHYIAWEILYMLMGLPILMSTPRPDWDHFLFNYGVIGSINFILFYSSAFFIIPAFLVGQRSMAKLVLLCLVAAILFTLLKYQVESWYFTMRLERAKSLIRIGGVFPAMPLGPPSQGAYFRNYIWFSVLIIIIAFAYRLLLTWYGQEKIRKELENQKLQAELSFLKMQINPHFLFNALNNIYSLAVLEKSHRTRDGIMKLSGLLRYMLYEKEDEEYKVSLDKEITHINHFIDLQKLRYDGDIFIQFSIEGDTLHKKIPPLLLFPLIENACKHGILQDAERPVNIQLTITGHQLQCSIHNATSHFLKDQTGGIGLANVRKRLSLLYPGRHTLTIRESADDFLVQLQLPL